MLSISLITHVPQVVSRTKKAFKMLTIAYSVRLVAIASGRPVVTRSLRLLTPQSAKAGISATQRQETTPLLKLIWLFVWLERSVQPTRLFPHCAHLAPIPIQQRLVLVLQRAATVLLVPSTNIVQTGV